MDFFRGLSYPLRGVAVLRRYPELARLWLAPIAITFVALAASAWLSFAYADDLLALAWAEPVATSAGGVLLSLVYWLVRAIVYLLGFALLAIACVALSTLIAAPFNDALSEAIEERTTGRPARPFSFQRALADAGRTVRIELLKLCVYASVMGPLLVLSWLVPGVGQVVYVVFGVLFTAVYFAIDYVDFPLARRGWGVRDRIALLRRKPFLLFGFGLGVWACLFVPLVNLAFMPCAVAGGTKLFLDLESEV